MTINVAEWFAMTSAEKDIAISCIAPSGVTPTARNTAPLSL